MKIASCLPAVAILLLSNLLTAQNNGWNDDAQKCKDLSGDDAIAACTRAIGSGQLSPENLATTYYNRSYEYRAKEEYDAAIADLNEAIRLNPTMTEAYNNRGLALFDKGAFEPAIPDYEKALQLDPKHVNAFYGLGNIYKAKGEYAKAIDDYNQAMQLKPDFTNAFINRGNVYLLQQQFDLAIADYKQALRTKPGSMYPALLLAIAEMHKGNNEVANELTEESTSFANDWPFPVVQFYLGKADEDNVAEAAKDPDAKRQREQFCEMYFYLGEWQIFHAQREKGIESLKRAQEQCQPSYYENDLVKMELKRLATVHPSPPARK
jgi:lipoprotein NlpI